MTVKTTFFAVVVMLCVVPAALGQTAVKVSYDKEWYGPDGAVTMSESGDVYIANDGRLRHDRTMDTGERVSEITFPSMYEKVAVNHTTGTAIHGRTDTVFPIPSLENQPTDRLARPVPRGLLNRAKAAIAGALGLAPGASIDVDGIIVIRSESLGVEQRWGMPLEGRRINRPKQGAIPAQQIDQWVYVSPDRTVEVEVERIVTIFPEDGVSRLVTAKRASDIRYVPDRGDLFTVPSGIRSFDWTR